MRWFDPHGLAGLHDTVCTLHILLPWRHNELGSKSPKESFMLTKCCTQAQSLQTILWGILDREMMAAISSHLKNYRASNERNNERNSIGNSDVVGFRNTFTLWSIRRKIILLISTWRTALSTHKIGIELHINSLSQPFFIPTILAHKQRWIFFPNHCGRRTI